MEGKLSAFGGPRVHIWKWNLVMGPTDSGYSDWKDKKMRRWSCTMQERVLWPGRYGSRWVCPSWLKRLRKVCGAPWEWVYDEKTNAVIDSLKKVSRWRSTIWCQSHKKKEWWNKIEKNTKDGSTSGSGTIVDMCSIRWPHVGRGKEDWMFSRKMPNLPDAKFKLITYILG